jgi:hypothetical protein
MTGVSLAESSIDTTTSTTTTSPSTDSVSKSKSERTIEPNGTQVEKSRTYEQHGGRTDTSSSVTVKSPDGSASSTHHEEWSERPASESSVTKSTTVVRKHRSDDD